MRRRVRRKMHFARSAAKYSSPQKANGLGGRACKPLRPKPEGLALCKEYGELADLLPAQQGTAGEGRQAKRAEPQRQMGVVARLDGGVIRGIFGLDRLLGLLGRRP